MWLYCPQQAPIVPIVIFPGTTVIQHVTRGNTKLIATIGDDMAIMARGVVVQIRGGGFVRTAMGWLWFPGGKGRLGRQ